jgi:hypothetical protein
MKSFILYGLIAGASAMPHLGQQPEKRDLVIETKYEEVIETHWSTKTVWVEPGTPTGKVAAAGFEGYQKPKPTHQSKPKTTHKAKPKPKPKPTKAYTAPPPPPPTTTQAAPVTTSTTTPPPPPPPSTTTTSSVYTPPPPPKSTYKAPAPPKSTYTPPPPPTTTTSAYVAPTTSAAAAPAYTAPSSGGSSGGSSSGGDHSGDGTYYDVGLGSCGLTSSAGEAVVAIGHGFMDKTNPGNPNANPMCGKKIKLTYEGNVKYATIVDTCAGCAGADDVDMSTSLFKALAPNGNGRIFGVEWSIVS